MQAILNAAFPAYAATHRLPLSVHRAVSAVRRCRTGALGHNARKCRAGHVLDVRRNSCRHRACPQCGARRAQRWLEQWQARLLPVTHFHVIFTVPSEFHTLWRWNRKPFAAAMFAAAQRALFTLLAEPHYLGASPGLLLGLHTWGSALPIHLHLHGLVTAGGVDPAGQWVATRPNFLVWGPRLRDTFRDHLVERLRRLLARQALALPPTLPAPAVAALLGALERRPWHVRIEPPYASGNGLLVYLARYLRGGPIKNHRLLTFSSGHVALRYRQYRGHAHPKARTMSLPVEEFLDRWLAHVPAPGLHMVRAYGLYARHQRALLQRCRLQLQPGWQPAPLAAPVAERCPQCGAALIVVVSRPLRSASPSLQKPMGPGPPTSGMFN